MADSNTGPAWSAAQWEKVSNAVTEAFAKANVASKVLPCYGPLADSAEYVRDERFTRIGATVTVADDATVKLFNLTVRVELSSEQVAEEALSTAVMAFRQAANTLAQVQDDIIFNGFDDELITQALNDRRQRGPDGLRADVTAARGRLDDAANSLARARRTQLTRAGQQFDRAADAVARAERVERAGNRTGLIAVSYPEESPALAPPDPSESRRVAILRAKGLDVGEFLVRSVVDAISALEDDSHPGPFACVLGSALFDEAHRPVEQSMVLPADRILPILKGPLLRSGQMDPDTGIVVSQAANNVDIVVATPPRAQFLQVTERARYVFRVYEKFALRIKDLRMPSYSYHLKKTRRTAATPATAAIDAQRSVRPLVLRLP